MCISEGSDPARLQAIFDRHRSEAAHDQAFAGEDVGPAAPPEQFRHVRTWGPRTTTPEVLTTIEDRITRLLVHRLDGRPELCTAAARYCYACKLGVPARWVGYCGAVTARPRLPIVWQMTPGAYLNFEPLRRWRSAMRGRGWWVWRRTSAITSAMMVGEAGYWPHSYMPPRGWTRLVLARMWKIPALEVDALDQSAGFPKLDDGSDAVVS